MAFCKNCGKQLEENKKFCASCGASVTQSQAAAPENQPKQQQTAQQGVDRLVSIAQNTKDETEGMDKGDIEKNKVYGGLAYFLFFLPFICCPESKYGRFHANQGLLLLILSVASGIFISILSAILTWRLWWLSSFISFVIGILIFIIGVIGLINGFTGKAKELPVIGGVRIIK